MLFYFNKLCFRILFSFSRCSLSWTIVFFFYFFVLARGVLHYFHFVQKVFISCFTNSYRSLQLMEALLSGNFVPEI